MGWAVSGEEKSEPLIAHLSSGRGYQRDVDDGQPSAPADVVEPLGPCAVEDPQHEYRAQHDYHPGKGRGARKALHASQGEVHHHERGEICQPAQTPPGIDRIVGHHVPFSRTLVGKGDRVKP